MKRILYITICLIILIAPLIDAAPTFAAQPCIATDCEIPIGAARDIKVFSYDTAGNPILDVPVAYTWTTNIGVITMVNPTTNGGTTTIGASTITLTIPPSTTATGGTVSVRADYGGGSATKVFTITTTCAADPKLYFGIGSVKDAGSNNWYSNTAEIMETCYSEYKLYGGTGKIK